MQLFQQYPFVTVTGLRLPEFRAHLRRARGQPAEPSTLGSDAGVSHATARDWLSLLETSYIAFRLRPLHANLTKRLVKAPKLYFYDVGLAAYLTWPASVGLRWLGTAETHCSGGRSPSWPRRPADGL